MTTEATDLNLPRFDIPDLPSKPITPQAYHAWLDVNRRQLLESGRLEAILSDPSRCPADARFTL